MIERTKRAMGFAIGALLVMCCMSIGKVAALDVPHSPVSIMASIIQDVTAPTPSVISDANPSADDVDAPRMLTAVEEAAPVAQSPAAPAKEATRKSLYQVVMDGQSAVNGTLQVAEYAVDGAVDKLIPAAETAVKLISYCETAYESVTDAEGNFRLEGVTAGVYTLMADGPLGVLVMRVSIEAQGLTPPTELNALLVPNVDAHYVRSVIHERLPQEATLPQYISFERLELPDAPIPPSVPSDAGSVSAIPHDFEMSSRLLRLNATTGGVDPVTESSAELIRNGRGVMPVNVESDGQCDARSLEAEHYSFVAIGIDGLCAIGVEAATCGPIVDAPPDVCCTELAVVPYDQCSQFVEEYVEEVPLYDQYGAGGYGGCCGGGGFGGGGGGGYGGGDWGALLGLAGLAGLAALVDDDNDPRQPATPF